MRARCLGWKDCKLVDNQSLAMSAVVGSDSPPCVPSALKLCQFLIVITKAQIEMKDLDPCNLGGRARATLWVYIRLELLKSDCSEVVHQEREV